MALQSVWRNTVWAKTSHGQAVDLDEEQSFFQECNDDHSTETKGCSKDETCQAWFEAHFGDTFVLRPFIHVWLSAWSAGGAPSFDWQLAPRTHTVYHADRLARPTTLCLAQVWRRGDGQESTCRVSASL